MAIVAENRRIVAVCVAKAGWFVVLRSEFLKLERIDRGAGRIGLMGRIGFVRANRVCEEKRIGFG